jgi:hypothetical protein
MKVNEYDREAPHETAPVRFGGEVGPASHLLPTGNKWNPETLPNLLFSINLRSMAPLHNHLRGNVHPIPHSPDYDGLWGDGETSGEGSPFVSCGGAFGAC